MISTNPVNQGVTVHLEKGIFHKRITVRDKENTLQKEVLLHQRTNCVTIATSKVDILSLGIAMTTSYPEEDILTNHTDQEQEAHPERNIETQHQRVDTDRMISVHHVKDITGTSTHFVTKTDMPGNQTQLVIEPDMI